MEVGDILVVQHINEISFADTWNISIGDLFRVASNEFPYVGVKQIGTTHNRTLGMHMQWFYNEYGHVVKKEKCIWK